MQIAYSFGQQVQMLGMLSVTPLACTVDLQIGGNRLQAAGQSLPLHRWQLGRFPVVWDQKNRDPEL